MPFSSLRSSGLFRRVRRSHLVHEVVRPAYARQQIKSWWADGRPVPPPHSVKLAAIQYLADCVGAKTLVETGAFRGDTVRALRGRFELLASIEIAPELARPLQQEFAHDSSVPIILGDSGQELGKLLAEIKGPVIFWLDAHSSGGPTGGGDYVPIYAELDAIAKQAHPHHAVLIDDLIDFRGQDGYPTAEALVRHLEAAGYYVTAFNNMVHAIHRPV
jgi:hypothetical protein